MRALADGEIQVGDRLLTHHDQMLTFQVMRPPEASNFMVLLTLMMPHSQPELAFARLATGLMIDSKLVADLGLRSLIEEGLRLIDTMSHKANGLPFRSATEDQQLEILQTIEDSPFFQTVLHIAKADFYNRHLVWKVLGYPDLDHEAGYLDDRFDQLDLRAI